MTTARDDLDRALIDMATEGRRPRCAEPGDDLWTSDDHDERRRAAQLCRACPVLRPCAEAAEEQDERWHTWGGTDRHRPRTNTRRTP